MKISIRRRLRISTGTVLASALLLCLPFANNANALDPRPRTYKERARHDFRDVQLGLCHPSDGTPEPKSVKCSEARQQFEPSKTYKK